MTPDGAGVVFELTDEGALVGRDLLPAAQRGMYYVRADGSGLRRLGAASRVPGILFVPPDTRYFTGGFTFDPGGRQFTYPDLGPDDAGDAAPQVFVQHLASGERRQLTRFGLVGQNGASGTIYFQSQCDPLGRNPDGVQLFAIQPDGTGLEQVTNARGFVRGADRTGR